MKSFQSIFGEMVKEYGFQKRTNTKFFLPKEDIVAFFSIDCPSGLFYVQFGIIPLYFPPCGMLYYTYGNRMKHMDSSLMHHLSKESSDDEINAWCEKAKEYLSLELMPLISFISTASGVREYIIGKRAFNGTGPIACAPNHLYELLVYTELFLNHIPDARVASTLFFQSLQDYPYSPAAKKELENRVNQTFEIAKDCQKLTALFNQWRVENMLLFKKSPI